MVEEEDFSREDDLLDWEYANAALRWWKNRIEDLRHVAGDIERVEESFGADLDVVFKEIEQLRSIVQDID